MGLRFEEWCSCGAHTIIEGRDGLAVYAGGGGDWNERHAGCAARANAAPKTAPCGCSFTVAGDGFGYKELCAAHSVPLRAVAAEDASRENGA